MMPPRDTLLRILEVGGRAISPYNLQPWRFRITEGGVYIHILRTKNFFLKLRGVSHMTLGFLLENLEAGARHAGFQMETEVLGNFLNLDRPIARVSFRSDPAAAALDVEHVLRRRTNRFPYSSLPLTVRQGEFMEEIQRSLSDGSMRFEFITGERLETFSQILAELEAVRYSNTHLMTEALEYIRVGEKDNALHRDRLDFDTLGLTAWEQRKARVLLRYPGLHPFVTWGAFERERRRREHHMTSSVGLLVSMVEREDFQTYIELGRRVQRSLNEACRQGLDTQPVLGGLYVLHLIFENLEIFSLRQKETLLTCSRDLEILLGVPDRRVAFISRVGTGAPPAPPSLRKLPEDLILPPLDLSARTPPVRGPSPGM